MKIGAPQQAPPQPGPEPAASMEWGALGSGVAPAPAAESLDLAPPPSQHDLSSGSHAVAELQERARQRRVSDRQQRPSGAGRSSDVARRSSSSGRVSDVSGRAKRVSRRGPRQREREVEPEAVAYPCPVCEQVIARIATECPHCGVVLRGPSAAAQLVERAKALVGPALGVALLVGGGAYAYHQLTGDPSAPPRVARVAEERAAPDQEAAEPGPGEARPAESPRREPGPADGERTEAVEVEAGGDAAAPAGDRPAPPEPAPQPARPEPARPQPAAPTPARIPPGPLAPLFERLQAAEVGAVPALLAELREAEGVVEAAELALESEEEAYRLRVHRLLLLAGDEEARRARIEASLAKDSGGRLLQTVLAAVELDAEGLRAPLQQQLSFDPRGAVARALADALLEERAPGPNLLRPLEQALEVAPADTRIVLGPLLLDAGDSARFGDALSALEHPDPPVQRLAQGALARASAGLGPGAGDPGAWRAWYDELSGPLAELATACAAPARGGPSAGDRARAKAALVARGGEVLRAIAVFLRDRRARTPEAGAAMGDVIARCAGPQDVPGLERVLAALDPGSSEAGAPVLAGALLAADAAIAGPVVTALLGLRPPPLATLASTMPDLIERPSAGAVAPLIEYAQSVAGVAREQAWQVAASLRAPQLVALVCSGDAAVPGRARRAVMQRLGSDAVEEALLEVLDGGARVAEVRGADEALALLGEVGTSAEALPKLLRRLDEQPSHALVSALRKLVGPGDERRLKKVLEAPGTVAVEACALLEDLGTPAAIAALGRVAKGEGATAERARRALLALGDPAARELARAPFEHMLARAKEGRRVSVVPSLKEVRALGRCGRERDAKLLLDVISDYLDARGRGVGGQFLSELILAIGELRARDAAPRLEGYVFRGHEQRVPAAIALALIGAEAQHERIAQVALGEGEGPRGGDEEATLAAAQAFLVGERARDTARAFLPVMERRGDGLAPTAIAYALTLAGDGPGLEQLAAGETGLRAAVARGIAWAAASREVPAPTVLERLRLDPDPVVRAEAAVAAAYLKLEGAARDVALALVSAGGERDRSNTRFASSHLARLANVGHLTTLRAALWDGYRVVRKDGMTYRPGLGGGRVREVERAMRRR